MIINRQNLEFLFLQFEQRFQGAFEKQSSYWEKYAEEVPSSTDKNVYGWIADIAGMRKWDGPRHITNVVSRSYELKNEDFEKTIALDRNKFEDDQFSFFSKSVDMLGMQAKWWPDDIMTAALVAGITSLCWDGQFFFDSDHPVNLDNPAAGTFSNRFDSTTSGARPLNAANYAFVRASMMKIPGEDGRPLRVKPNVLMVPPDLEATGRQILNADFIAQAVGSNAAEMQTNVWKSSAELVVNERLTDSATWYLFSNDRGIKPLLFQQRKAPEFVFLNKPTDNNAFFDKQLIFGVDSRGAAGYSLPFLAARAST
jgi:phage major head subunit gpT-like protein